MDIQTLAGAYPTPFFLYDAAVIRARLAELVEAFKNQRVTLHYAVKANDNRAVIQLARDIGACLVSAGEMQRAMDGDIAPAKMLMNGVGKTEADIRFALDNGIGQLNVESLPELHRIAAIARTMQKRAVICLRLNPEVAATTHSHITTARRTDKFGLLAEDLPEARAIVASHTELDWRGFSCHIGSQIHEVEELKNGYRVMADLFRAERQQQPQFDRLDLGGGFGVSYTGDHYARPADYAAMIAEMTGDLQQAGVTIQLEPGRFLVAEAGQLITEVQYVKNSGGTRFVVVDAAMNNLIRPALYQAYHPVTLLRPSDAVPQPVTLVGPVCESSDCFGRDYMLPDDVKAGDMLSIGCAGAYGAVMSSQYNARPRLAEVMADGTQHRLIRRAFTAADYDAVTLA